MNNLIEIRWHGRGGMGAVTASKIVADAALKDGKFIQAFPEYGPERMGAPIRSFTRISQQPITIHSQVENPDVVVVLDPTLLGVVDVCEGLFEDGVLIVNTSHPPSMVRQQLELKGRQLVTVDATKIALDTLGRNIPNTPMVGALVKATEVVNLEVLLEEFKIQYSSKFSPDVVSANLEAIKTAYNEVQSE
jgi:pyruvate ferredoxin oxidoreductase gamma subunit